MKEFNNIVLGTMLESNTVKVLNGEIIKAINIFGHSIPIGKKVLANYFPNTNCWYIIAADC